MSRREGQRRIFLNLTGAGLMLLCFKLVGFMEFSVKFSERAQFTRLRKCQVCTNLYCAQRSSMRRFHMGSEVLILRSFRIAQF